MSVFKLWDIVARDPLKELDHAITFEPKPRHVRDVEHAGALSNGFRFDKDAGVLDWHFVPSEGNHSSVECKVSIEQRRSEQGVRHWEKGTSRVVGIIEQRSRKRNPNAANTVTCHKVIESHL